MTFVIQLVVLLSIVVTVPTVTTAQVDEFAAKGFAANLVREKEGFNLTHPLRATRREDWEDALFGLQVRIKGRIAKAAYFFEVAENGYFVLSPDEAVHINTNDGGRVWVVAVAHTEGRVYGLYGFAEAELEFRKLAADSSLAVLTPADAEAEALLFFDTVKDPHGQTLILHSRQLKHKVEDYFFSKLSQGSAESQTEAWWHGFSALKKTDSLGVTATRIGEEDYATSISHIRSVDRSDLQLVVMSLHVSRTGICETIGTKLVYPRPQ